MIDRIVQAQDAVAIEERNYEAMLTASQAQQRGASRGRAPEGAEAGDGGRCLRPLPVMCCCRHEGPVYWKDGFGKFGLLGKLPQVVGKVGAFLL